MSRIDPVYTLKLSEKQAEVVCTACEVLARLGIGQFRDALAYLPLDQEPRTEDYVLDWGEDLDLIGDRLSRHMIGNVDGWNSSLSIHYGAVKPDAKIAWDLFQILRHRLARDNDEDYSLTLPASEQPLVKIERNEAT